MAHAVQGKGTIVIHNHCGFKTRAVWRGRDIAPVKTFIDHNSSKNLQTNDRWIVIKKFADGKCWLAAHMFHGDFDIDEKGLWAGAPGHHAQQMDTWGTWAEKVGLDSVFGTNEVSEADVDNVEEARLEQPAEI